MIIRCKSCVAAFAVDDVKVADKKFAFTCPKCGIENVIDNRRLAGSSEFNEPVSDDLFDENLPEEKSVPSKKQAVTTEPEEAAADTAENDFSFDDEILFDDAESAEKPVKKTSPAAEPSDDHFFDDLDIEIGEDAVKAASEMPEPDFTDIELENGLADFDAEETAKPSAALPDRDKKITGQDEIDAMFAASSPESGPARGGDVTVDLDSLDIDFEEKPAAKIKKIEPAEDFGTGEMDFLEEEPADAKTSAKKPEEDLTALEIDTFDLLEEPEPQQPKKKTETVQQDEDITIDIDSLDIDIDETEAVPAKTGSEKKAAASDDVLFDFDIPEEETAKSAAVKNIPADDSVFDFDIPEAVPAKTVAAKKVDTDEALFDLEVPEAVPAETVTAKKSALKEEPLFDFDITEDESDRNSAPEGKGEELFFDDEPDLDIETAALETTGKKQAAPGKKPLETDEDITLDIDSLDIDIEEPVHASIKALPEKKTAERQADDSITLDIDSLDIEVEEPLMGTHPSKGELPEEDIEIDLDSLDFDTEKSVPAAARSKNVREIMKEQAGQGDDEDIKLNLDELDIDINEISEKDMDFVKKGKAPSGRKAIIEEAPEDEDESITIDLDSLDIEVAENAPILDSEISEEDEKLTLEDAGMTFDELTTSERKELNLDLGDEEDIKLTLDEVDPEMRLEQIGETVSPDEPLLVDTIEELPEINLDEFDERPAPPQKKDYKRIVPEEDLDISVEVPAVKTRHPVRSSMGAAAVGSHARGTTVFTVDFSLKYSRISALLRLLQLYTISLIPHFIVVYIYTVLSGILGFINQIVILSSGRCVEDFAQIAENTLRYYLYIETCITGIVEDRPEFAGRERIDHQMQLNLTYPLKYSKLLAALRLSVLGIFLVTLPHLVMLLFVTLFVPLIYFAGIIWVIITGRWPNPLFMFLTMYFRYMARISAFMIGLTDQYPPFRFE